MGLDSIVSVSVTTQSAQVSEPGFGRVLIVGAHKVFAERQRIYAAASGLLTDGFTTDDPEYLAAVAIKSANPCPEDFAVGRRANLPTLQFTVIPTLQEATDYTVTVNGTDKTYTSGVGATLSGVVLGMVAAIGAVGGFVVEAIGGAGTETHLTITAVAAGSWLRLATATPSILDVEQTHADPGLAADLAAIVLESTEFYGLCLTTASKAEVVALAAWVEANSREAVQASQETAIVSTVLAAATDVAATLQTAAYARTGVIYHPDNGAFADAAWMGKNFAKDPGAATFKFKTLAGVPVNSLTPTQRANAEAKNCNIYTTVGGVNMTSEGVSASGEYLDVVRDRDWHVARLQTRIFTALVNNDKIPFTDSGVAIIEAQVRAQLAESVEAGFLAADPAPTVTVPKVSTVATADKARRNLPGVTFTGTIAGAIHSLEIDGVVTV